VKTEVFSTREAWQDYALDSLKTVFELARPLGLSDSLHLWPDKSLGSENVVKRQLKPEKYQKFLQNCWTRVSEWPK